jgi:hypothetical protein
MNARFAAIAVAVAFASSIVGCGSSVVGGECNDGYELCDGRCVAMGECHARTTVPVPSGAAIEGDAGPSDSRNAATDAGSIDGGSSDGETHESDPVVADAGTTTDETSVAHDDAAPICESPLSYCNGACVDLGIDPDNCGACGNFCPSGLCNGGKCRGAKAGHFVAIGHDFKGVSPSSAAAQVAFGAVFLPSTDPVRVLSFDAWADTSSAGADDKEEKNLGGAKAGRTWT